MKTLFLIVLILVSSLTYAADVANPDDYDERIRLAVEKISEKLAQENGNSGLRIEVSKIGIQTLDSLGVPGVERYFNTVLVLDVYNSRPTDKIDLTFFEMALYEVITPDVDTGVGFRFLTFQHQIVQPGLSSNYLEAASGSLRLNFESVQDHYQLKLLGRVGFGQWSGFQINGVDRQGFGVNNGWFPSDLSVGASGQITFYRTITFVGSVRSIGHGLDGIVAGNRKVSLEEHYSKKDLNIEVDLGRVAKPLPNDSLYLVAGYSKSTGEMHYRQSLGVPSNGTVPPVVQPGDRRITFGVKWVVPKFKKRQK
jgi:hypothetical protein